MKFCCLPDYHHPIQEQFRELTEYLLPRLDHEDSQAVSMGYGVYRKAMETGFQLEHIKEAIYQNREVTEKSNDRESTQNQEQKPPENNLDTMDNFGEKIQEKADVSHLLKTDVENKTSKRKKGKKKEESDFQKSFQRMDGCVTLCFHSSSFDHFSYTSLFGVSSRNPGGSYLRRRHHPFGSRRIPVMDSRKEETEKADECRMETKGAAGTCGYEGK